MKISMAIVFLVATWPASALAYGGPCRQGSEKLYACKQEIAKSRGR